MSVSDGEHSLRKTPSTLRNAALSPLPSLSLTRDHITEALAKSPDGGATLDLAYKGLTDVGESGAEELATVGQDDESITESPVIRCVFQLYSYVRASKRLVSCVQDCARTQSAYYPAHGVLSAVAPALPRTEEQQLYCVSRRRTLDASSARVIG